MKTLFISDLHLCEERPQTTRAFLAFLSGPARKAQALYILGDLFEYWAGDDDDSPLISRVTEALTELAQRGVKSAFMRGNRDFLIGDRFAQQCGLILLDDPSLIELDGTRILLTHGDALCIDDLAYQQYRETVRNPEWIVEFLAQPLPARHAFIEKIRMRSEQAKRDKLAAIMDVNPLAVEDLLRQHAYPTLIHGHTHRPARHLHRFDGKQCERWVLADWDTQAHYLAMEGGSISAHTLRAPPEPKH